MNFLLNNWFLIIGAIALIIFVAYAIFSFTKKTKQEQIKKIKEWLLYAVVEAEKELGSGTGQIKLRYVYEMFILRFSFISIFITFDSFSKMVDEALEKLKDLLNQNEDLSKYLE